jgi:hypothetical protein
MKLPLFPLLCQFAVFFPMSAICSPDVPAPTIESIHALGPGEGRVVGVPADDKSARQGWQRAVRWYHSLPAGETPAHPAARIFPGAVPPTAERVETTVKIDPNQPRWQSTGLYAAPGETVMVKVPAAMTTRGWKIRVGCHSDELWRHEKWRRFPVISRVFEVKTEEVPVANAFGGLIYIDIPRDETRGGFQVPTFGGYGWIGEKPSTEPSVEVTIAGAVRAPMFVLGRDDPNKWSEALAATRAPWGEIAGKHLIMSLPRAELEKVSDPAALAEFWDRTLDACWDFAGWPGRRLVPERFVFDVQISAGFMHSGYPIMAHVPSAKDAIDLDKLRREGQWGLFHELGHNHQGRAYTFNSFVEVTVNLHTLYLMKTLCGLEPRAARGVLNDLDKLLQQRLEEKKIGPFEDLAMFIPLIETFGFESLTSAFQKYLSAEGIKGLTGRESDPARMDALVRRYSQAVGKNLCSYFDLFGIKAGEETRKLLASLDPWMPGEGFIASFSANRGDDGKPGTSEKKKEQPQG